MREQRVYLPGQGSLRPGPASRRYRAGGEQDPEASAPRGTSVRPSFVSAGQSHPITAGLQQQSPGLRAAGRVPRAGPVSERPLLFRPRRAPLPSPARARPAHAPHLVYPARRGAAAGGRQVSPHAQESGPRWAAARWRLRPPFAREPPSSEHPKQSPAPPPN